MEEEKREDPIIEEDTDDILEEISDSSDEVDEIGKTAEDAVSPADTITGSDADSDTVSQPVIDTERSHDHSHDHNHSHLDNHDNTHTHDHHAVVNQNKPWEARNVEMNETPDNGMGTGAHSGSDEHISIDKDVFWKYVKIIALIAVVILGYNYFIVDNTGTVNEPANNLPDAVAEVGIGGNAIKGDENAPVTIIEFSDYECPFCARFYSQTLNQIDEQYIKTGKVKLVYRDYPLSNHPNAPKAAEAAECSGEQGKYYEMHDILFENGVSGGVASYKAFAGQIGLDQGVFDDCLDSGKMASEVQKDFADGNKAGVQGTPAFFVNGKLISGAQPFSVFQQAIEAELA